jgi:hypothetical protein
MQVTHETNKNITYFSIAFVTTSMSISLITYNQ